MSDDPLLDRATIRLPGKTFPRSDVFTSTTDWLNSVTSRLLNKQANAEARQLAGAGDRDVVKLVYGEDRVGGQIINIAPVTPWLYIQVLWAHQGHSVNDIRLSGAALPAGTTTTDYDGSQSAVDSVLASAMATNGVSSYADTLAGYMYSVVKMPIVAFTGSLDFTARIKGRKLFDPRKATAYGGSGSHVLATPSTWEWSDNPSLADADFLYASSYGCGQAVDWYSVKVAADANDALVGGAEKSRLLGIAFIDQQPVKTISETLRAYAACWHTFGVDGIKLVPDIAGGYGVVYDYSAGEIAAMSAVEKQDPGNTPTVIEIVYTNRDAIPWRDASSVQEATGVSGGSVPRRISQVAMPGIQRHTQATREAIGRLNKLKTSDTSFTLDVFDKGIAHEIGDIIGVTHPVGFSTKPFRVIDDPELVGLAVWRLACSEYDSAAYSTSLATGPTFPDTVFANAFADRPGLNLLRNADWTDDSGYPLSFYGDNRTTPGWVFVPNTHGLILRNYDNGHQYNFGRGGICHYIPNFNTDEYCYSQQDIPFDGVNYPDLQFEVSAYAYITKANVILYARVLNAAKDTVIQDFTETVAITGTYGDPQAGYVEGNYRRLWVKVDVSANGSKANARWLRILVLTQANQTQGSGYYPFVAWHKAMICRAPSGVTRETATPWNDGSPSVLPGLAEPITARTNHSGSGTTTFGTSPNRYWAQHDSGYNPQSGPQITIDCKAGDILLCEVQAWGGINVGYGPYYWNWNMQFDWNIAGSGKTLFGYDSNATGYAVVYSGNWTNTNATDRNLWRQVERFVVPISGQWTVGGLLGTNDGVVAGGDLEVRLTVHRIQK
jgi:hypothetical protein